MNYIIEWDEKVIHMLNNNLGKSAWGPLPQWGLTLNLHSSRPAYLYFQGAAQREDMFFSGSYHYSPPIIDSMFLERGDKTWIKNSVRGKRMFILSKETPIEVFKEIIEIERKEREKAYVPECAKPYIIKLDFKNILHDCK